MSFLMKIISSFEVLRLFISTRLIDEYIRAIRERENMLPLQSVVISILFVKPSLSLNFPWTEAGLL